MDPCPIGSWKGSFDLSTPCNPCGTGLTTLSTGSISAAACVAAPGYFVDSITNLPKDCPIGTYKAAAGNSSACTPCESGLSTLTITSISITQCVAAAGFYINAGVVEQCPIGTWKSTVANSTSCSTCGTGLTTGSLGSISAAACVAAPGWFVSSGGSVVGGDGGSSGGVLARCAIGTYKGSSSNATECTVCPIGSTTMSMGSASPSDCVARPGWTVSDSTGNFERCVVGTFKAAVGNASCTSCFPDLTTSTSGATAQSACVATAGHYVDPTSGAVVPCPLSTFKAAIGNTSCLGCPDHTLTAATAATSADACLAMAGYYTVDSTVAPCPIGSFKASVGSGSCTSCPEGATTLAVAAESASECVAAPGWFVVESAGYSMCYAGSYKEAVGNATECTPCSTLLSTQDEGSTSPSQCEAFPGHAIDHAGAVVACVVGTYKEVVGNQSCTACSAGLTTAVTGTVEASLCGAGPGYYIPIAGGPGAKCGFGTYKPDFGNGTCTPCGQNLNTTEDGETSALACLVTPGYHIINDNIVPCPVGSYGVATPANITSCSLCGNHLTTVSEAATHRTECLAIAGYDVPVHNGVPKPCPVGTYKGAVGNVSCTACGSHLTNEVTGATNSDGCVAEPGKYLYSYKLEDFINTLLYMYM